MFSHVYIGETSLADEINQAIAAKLFAYPVGHFKVPPFKRIKQLDCADSEARLMPEISIVEYTITILVRQVTILNDLKNKASLPIRLSLRQSIQTITTPAFL